MPDLAALLDDARTFTAVDHFTIVAAARAQGFRDGIASERLLHERLLRLVVEVVRARRRRMEMEAEPLLQVDAHATAEDVETRAVCALLDFAEDNYAPPP